MDAGIDYGLIYRLEDEEFARAKNYVCPVFRSISAVANEWDAKGWWFVIPENNGLNGEMRGMYGTWATLGPDGKPIVVDGHIVPLRVHYCNEVHGEIVWKCFHDDPDWPCTECGHHESFHYSSVDYGCTHGEYKNEQGRTCYPCNCGNNIGR